MRHFLVMLLLIPSFITGCVPVVAPTAIPPARTSEPRPLLVFAAASLTDSFTEIGKNFEATNPGVMVTFNFAGSQALQTQIEEGAPADVFASANTREMDTLVTDGFVTGGTPQVFLTNQLVVILPANNPAGLSGLEDLANADVKLILAAEQVPVGKYARQVLDQLSGQFGGGFNDKVLANVVSNEDNVKQVVAKVQLGEADAGIVYTSDAVAAPDLRTLEIPAGLNVIANYPIAPLNRSAHSDLATSFIEYVLSPDGQSILKKWGFIPVR